AIFRTSDEAHPRMPVKRKSPKARRAPVAAKPAAKRVVKLRKPAAKPAAKRVAKPAARPGAKRIAKPAAKPLERPARRLKPPTDRALIEQLTAEVAIVNSIQQGMAGGLDFQGIIDLVGDKLREVFHTGDIGIRWHDPSANLIHYLYQYEHGERLYPPPLPPKANFLKVAQTRRPIVIN